MSRLYVLIAMVVSVAVGGAALMGPTSSTSAQQGYGTSFTVDGKSAVLSSGCVAATKPTFAGQGTPGSKVVIRLEPGGTEFAATVGADGKYSVATTRAPAPGEYKVLVNGELVACFKVQEPAPPATGDSFLDSATGGAPLLLAILGALAVGVGVTIVSRRRV